MNDEDRDALSRIWLQREVASREKTVADAVAQRLRKGEDIAAAAKSVNADLISKADQAYPRKQEEPDAQIRATAFDEVMMASGRPRRFCRR